MNYFGVQPFVTHKREGTSQQLLSTKVSGQVAHLDQSYQNERGHWSIGNELSI